MPHTWTVGRRSLAAAAAVALAVSSWPAVAAAADEASGQRVRTPKQATAMFKYTKASGPVFCADSFALDTLLDKPVKRTEREIREELAAFDIIQAYRRLAFRSGTQKNTQVVSKGRDDGDNETLFYVDTDPGYGEVTGLPSHRTKGVADGFSWYRPGEGPSLKRLQRLVTSLDRDKIDAAMDLLRRSRRPGRLEDALGFPRGGCWYHVEICWSKKTLRDLRRARADAAAVRTEQPPITAFGFDPTTTAGEVPDFDTLTPDVLEDLGLDRVFPSGPPPGLPVIGIDDLALRAGPAGEPFELPISRDSGQAIRIHASTNGAGSVIVADERSERLFRFELSGVPVPGHYDPPIVENEPAWGRPIDVDFDVSGRILVTDGDSTPAIHILDADGAYIERRDPPVPIAGEDGLSPLYSVAMPDGGHMEGDFDGNLWRYDAEGDLVSSRGPNASRAEDSGSTSQREPPEPLAGANPFSPMYTLATPDGGRVEGDFAGNLWRYDAEGVLVSSSGPSGSGTSAPMPPEGGDADGSGRAWVAAPADDEVRVIDTDGTLAFIIGRDDQGGIVLDGPRSVTIDPAGNAFIVNRDGWVAMVDPDGDPLAIIAAASEKVKNALGHGFDITFDADGAPLLVLPGLDPDDGRVDPSLWEPDFSIYRRKDDVGAD